MNFKISRSQKKVLKTMTNFLTVRSTQTVSMGEASNHADASAGGTLRDVVLLFIVLLLCSLWCSTDVVPSRDR